jgi:parvulin-like peptidyl-prolyl isomerase
MLVLAACGSHSIADPGATSTPGAHVATAAPTPRPPATPVVSGGDVAAVVNGHNIPMSQFKVLLVATQREYVGQQGVTMAQIESQAMNQVIGNEIVREYAAKHNISVPKSAVDSQVSLSVKKAGSRSRYRQELATLGLTESSYRFLIAQNLLVEKVADRLFPLKSAHVRHILIALQPQGKSTKRTYAQARKIAVGLKEKLSHGASFAALARKYSDDPGSAAKGGDLGQVFPGQMVPTFDKASFSLPLHQYALVKSPYGYHIIEVLSRGPAHIAPGDSQAQQAAQASRQQQFGKWAQAQEKKATIKRLARVKGATSAPATVSPAPTQAKG